MKTKSGKAYAIGNSRNIGGHGVTGSDYWMIESIEPLSHEEVEEIIESKKPFAGYGASSFTRKQKLPGRPHEIEVRSNASCD